MNTAKQLYQLQETDLEIEAGEMSLSRMNGELGNRQALDRAQAGLDAEKRKLDELKRRQRLAEAETDDLTAKMAEVEKQLYGGKINNPKELTGLQHEMETLRGSNDQAETRALEIIEQVEAEEKFFAAAQAGFRKLEGEWQERQQQLAGEIGQLKGKLGELGRQRREAAGDIEAEALDLYERIRRQKKPAVAKVEQGICHVCRITLSASEVQRVRGGNLIQCGSCGRLLFLS